ncbi:LysR family transcriptional regulator [Variovorax sp. LjRoot290]|jgi:DNA-binding transcriptional LysR family regulator|uniref:LysR family transcriptional regulator n=1 Tax=Variovorax sp. LjRoot290 TaxID=3342316 RepID=UPI003ED035E9
MATTVKPPTPESGLHLPQLAAFAVVARELSFARAANALDVTPTAMSKTIRQLESTLGARLFNRTTRSVALTDAGAQLLHALAPALEQIRGAVDQVRASTSRPSGTLRINTSFVAHASLIEPHLPAFLARYPELSVEMHVDNGLSDIVSSGYDAGIRLGHALQRDMVAVPLGPLQQRVVVGAPAYLKAHGAPKTPRDLLAHDCIRQRLGARGRFLDWEFLVASKPTHIDVQGRLSFSEMRPALSAACHGAGLAYVFRQFAQRDIDEGRVVVLLDRYSPSREAFHLYYPHRAQMPAKLRLFVDFVREANWQAPD